MILSNKLGLLLLLLIPLLILWYRFINKRGKRFILFSFISLFEESDNKLKKYLFKSIFPLELLSLFFFIIAFTRPQLINKYNYEKIKGIDIMLTLDISGSMASMDFDPYNRLELAKRVIDDFINKRKNDRIGLVAFAGTSYTKCPLTTDFKILRYFLKTTKLGEIEDGTAIGMALANAVNRIKNSKAKTKIIILLTDGVNNKGEIDPIDAAKMAKDYNIRVYTIGIGKKGKAPYPVIDYWGNKKYIMVDVQIDENLLKRISNLTGGLYFRAEDKETLKTIFKEINKWEKSEIKKYTYEERKDIFHIFLLIGLIILLVSEIIKRFYLNVLP